MRVTQRVKKILRGVVQRYGPERLKRSLWNGEYLREDWPDIVRTAHDCVYSHVERFSRNGSILDLGCGPGTIGNELNPATYTLYTGVDISDVCIGKAKKLSEENHRGDKNSYCAEDIFSYIPDQQYDVILFGDSIYYIPFKRIAKMLVRYSRYLKPEGVFIVRIFDARGKHKPIIETIESNFTVVERELYYNSQISVVVFRARTK